MTGETQSIKREIDGITLEQVRAALMGEWEDQTDNSRSFLSQVAYTSWRAFLDSIINRLQESRR